jgi:hypothetical protein
MDVILLEIHNRKERCAWSPIAMTSHIRTLSMLFFQDSTGMCTTLFILSSSYATWLHLCVSKFDRIHSLLHFIIKLYPWDFTRDFTVVVATTQVLVLSSMYPAFSFWPIEWCCLWAHTESHLCPEVPTPTEDIIPLTPPFDKAIIHKFTHIQAEFKCPERYNITNSSFKFETLEFCSGKLNDNAKVISRWYKGNTLP